MSMNMISTVLLNIKEYVSFSINICPWQYPVLLGITVKVQPCDTPGCICANWTSINDSSLIATCETEPLFLYSPFKSETYS